MELVCVVVMWLELRHKGVFYSIRRNYNYYGNEDLYMKNDVLVCVDWFSYKHCTCVTIIIFPVAGQ